MKFTDIKIKTLRNTNEPSRNADLLIRAGYVDQVAAGIYSYLPLGKRVLENINNIIREEMNAIGGLEITMPALQPAENWKKTGRWDSLDVLFRFTSFYTKTDYALGSTHEEIVAPLAKKYVASYKDLPLYLYQIQTKFRDEKRAKSGLLRNREFPMKDLYSFHVDNEDLDKYYEIVAKAYENIYKRCGIGPETYYTYASGGSFSKYSHEFQTICDAGEDIIFVCEKCHVAINKEIIKDIDKCPECGNSKLEEKKAIEVGNIFKLGTKYSKPFELTYRDKDDREQDVVMGCYGIGPGRVMGTIVEKIADERGLVWPKEIAPFDVHLVTLDEKTEESQKIYDLLEKSGLSVLWDDRAETTGVKLADADLLGLPARVLVSEKTLANKKVEFKARDKKDFELISETELIQKINYVK